MKLKLIKKHPVAKDTVMFWFQPDRTVRYVAGQYIELDVPHALADNRKTKRWFTLSSSPSEEFLAITTKIDPVRPSSFKNALNNLSIGEIVPALPPMGDFVLPKDESLPLVFVAGGIGITPYRSILKYLLDTGQKRDIELIYAVRSDDEIAFEDIIRNSKIKFTKHIGHLNADDVVGYIHDLGKVIYVSGPERMVEALQKDLISKGADELMLRVDFFHNYD